jgi:hypothetical protein
MTHDGALPGWHYLGQSKDYLWGKFVPQGDRPAPVARVEKVREPEKTIVPDQEKDKHYRAILNQLSLSDRHLEDFHRRNLQPSEITYLEGVTRSLSYGYLIPFPNVDGQYCGAQMRRDSSGGGRYRWYTYRDDHSKHNESGELPLAVYRGGDLWIIEGTGVKPIVANIRHGVTAIGAAGGQHYLSPKTFSYTLAKLGNPNRVIFCPDAGDILNPHVLRRIRSNVEHLEALGLTVTIAWWNQDTKDKPDIDELPNLDGVSYLSPEEFWQLPDPELIKKIFEEVTTPPKPKWLDRVEHWQAWASRLDLTPTHTYQKPFTTIALPDKPMAVIVQGGMGTRKTSQAVKGLIEDHREKYPHAARINMSSRNLLQLQSVGIWGIPHHTQLETLNTSYGLGDVALCPDSIMKIDPRTIPPRSMLIGDEFEQTAQHILQAETFRNHPRYSAGAILARIKEIFEIVSRTGWVVLSEDGITNLGWEFLKDLTGLPDLEFEYHLCTWTNPSHQGRKVFLYEKKGQFIKAFLEHSGGGGKPWLPCDSRKFAETIQRQAIDQLGWELKDFPIVDSITAEEPWAKALTANTDEELTRLNLKALGNTGSWQSGVSFGDTPEANHFDSTWLYGCHTPPHILKQYPERYRQPVPIHTYIKEFAVATDDTGAAYLPETWKKNARSRRLMLNWLNGFIDRAPDDVSLSEAILRLEDTTDPEYGFWMKHLANFEARSCWGRANLRRKMVEIWQAKGYEVELISGNDRMVGADFNLTRAILDIEAAETIAALDANLTPTEARTILGSPSSTHRDRQKAEKCLFLEEFGRLLNEDELQDPQFWLKTLVGDGKKLTAAARLEWAAKTEANLGYQIQNERSSFLKKLNRATQQKAIHWDPRCQSIALKAQVLLNSPLMEAIGEGLHFGAWDSNSEWVKRIHEWGIENAKRIYRQMRLQVKPEHNPHTTAKKFLKILGYSTKTFKRRRDGGIFTYFVSHDELEGIREKLQECLSCKGSGVIQDLYKLPDLQKLDQLQGTIVFEKDRWFVRLEKGKTWLCHHSLDQNDRENWIFIEGQAA